MVSVYMLCVRSLARIISPDSKKRSWFSDSRKQKYFVAVCFSSPAGHKRANEPVNPFTGWPCRASGGYRADSRQKSPKHGKRDVPNTLCWNILGYNFFPVDCFHGEIGKLSAYVGFYSCYARIPCWFSMPA